MAWAEFFRALALVCILEGLMPFIAPARWRDSLQQLANAEPGRIRIFGAVLIGLGLLGLQFLG